MTQISLQHICKSFTVSQRPQGRAAAVRGIFHREKRRIDALKDLSFSTEEGELVGYIGPNGAGKSTTIKIMGGILTPEAGSCSILGRVPWKQRTEHVAHIGVVFGQRSQLWWDVPVRDSFELLRDIYGVPQEEYRRRLQELSDILGFSNLLHTPVRQLSLGQRMRCEVAAALLHSPRILFLDEPTIGLDAVSKLSLREFLKEENRRHGVTMILTTHDMDDIEALCSRVMTIGHGQLLYDGDLETLKARYAPLRRMRATLLADAPGDRELLKLPGVRRAENTGNLCTVWFNPYETPAHLLMQHFMQNYPVKDITVQEQDIDEMIVAMYQEMKL